MEKYKIYKNVNKHAKDEKTFIDYVFILQDIGKVYGFHGFNYWALPAKYNGKWLSSTFTKAIHRSELENYEKLKDYSEIQNQTKKQLIINIFEDLKNYF